MQLSHLTNLSLNENYLKMIDCSVFNDLVNLIELNLYGNLLSFLEPNTFVTMNNILS